ncbi:MAG: hypothetical protein ACPG77_11770, partial [Nannocystaceae bacterium]
YPYDPADDTLDNVDLTITAGNPGWPSGSFTDLFWRPLLGSSGLPFFADFPVEHPVDRNAGVCGIDASLWQGRLAAAGPPESWEIQWLVNAALSFELRYPAPTVGTPYPLPEANLRIGATNYLTIPYGDIDDPFTVSFPAGVLTVEWSHPPP